MIDYFEIPEFLKRKKGERRPRKGVVAIPAAPEPSSWDRIRERKKAKSRGHVATMKAVMADRAAVKAGKTWDARRGGWR